VGSLLGGFSLLHRCGVKKKQWALVLGVALELGGPVRCGTKEGGVRRLTGHASGGGRWRSTTGETGGHGGGSSWGICAWAGPMGGGSGPGPTKTPN
jgi:hypothetical protein